MTKANPYSTPAEGPVPSDAKLMQTVASHLAAARDNPPTIAGTLLKWPGTPLLLIVGAVGTAVLTLLVSGDGSELTSHWPLGFASMVFGAFLRDLGLARHVKRMWPPQSHFIDWSKVDQFKS